MSGTLNTNCKMNKISNPLEIVLTSDKLTETNVDSVRVLLNGSNKYSLKSFKDDECVVNQGEIVSDLLNEVDFSYAAVPLGLILKGSMVVKVDGHGVKILNPGDFIGLFETGDWTVNNRTRKIGDWSLFSVGDTEVLFLDESMISGQDTKAEDFRKYITSLAREDLVPKSLSKLPLLDWVASHTTQNRIPDCAIIIHTHVLPTSVALFRHLAHLVGTKNIFLIDKSYSTIRESLNEVLQSGVEVLPVVAEKHVPFESSLEKGISLMWKRFIEKHKKVGFKKLIILDDGADVLLSVPWNELVDVEVAGVEQTQRGITRMNGSSMRTPPVVAAASSGIKKLIESPFIGAAVVEKLVHTGILSDSKRVGIVGAGSIGQAIMDELKKIDKEYIFYDISDSVTLKNDARSRVSVDTLIENSDIIIGTTGTDFMRGVVLDRVFGEKIFVSASSSDVEFRTILQQCDVPENPFSDVYIKISDTLSVKVLNGGYPVNFDRKTEWEAAEDIVLTRCLLYIGVMQALQILASTSLHEGFFSLDKISQTKLLKKWLEEKGEDDSDFHTTSVVNATFLDNAKQTKSIWRDDE